MEKFLTNICIIVGTLLILGLFVFYCYGMSKVMVCLAEKLMKKINIKSMGIVKLLLYLLESTFYLLLLILIIKIISINIYHNHLNNTQAIILGLSWLIDLPMIMFSGALFSFLAEKYNHIGYLYKAIVSLSSNRLLKKAKNVKFVKLIIKYFKLFTDDYLFYPIWISSVYILLTFLVILEWPETYFPIASFCLFILIPLSTVFLVYFFPAVKEADMLEIIDLRRIILYLFFVFVIIWDVQRKYLTLFAETLTVEAKLYDVIVYIMISVYLALDRVFKIIIDHAQKL